MHIVVLTSFYYPFLNASARCFRPFLQELAKENQVDVICPPSDLNCCNNFYHDGIMVNYVDSLPNRLWTYIKTNQDSGTKQLLSKMLSVLYRGIRYLKYILGKPSYETSLIRPMVNELEKVDKENKIDIVLSISFPFYPHVAGLRYKKKNINVKWITYSADPLAYSESNRIEWWKFTAAKEIEREVYEKCDFCFTTDALYENVISDYKICRDKVYPIPFLITNDSYSHKYNSNPETHVLYAGFVFSEIRSPMPLINTFVYLPSVRLDMYVSGDRLARSQLSINYADNITINGLVTRDQYIKLLGEADILVSLSNTIRLQESSKVYELISTGKPIINFYYKKDSSYRAIEKYPLGINVEALEKPEILAENITSFIRKVKGKVVNKEIIIGLYPEHIFENQMLNVNKVFS